MHKSSMPKGLPGSGPAVAPYPDPGSIEPHELQMSFVTKVSRAVIVVGKGRERNSMNLP